MLTALGTPDLDPRVAESLPWVAWRHCDLNWGWLVKEAKRHDLQNRLGFVVALAKAVAKRHGDAAAVKVLGDSKRSSSVHGWLVKTPSRASQ
jgi:hypothetical protein